MGVGSQQPLHPFAWAEVQFWILKIQATDLETVKVQEMLAVEAGL